MYVYLCRQRGSLHCLLCDCDDGLLQTVRMPAMLRVVLVVLVMVLVVSITCHMPCCQALMLKGTMCNSFLAAGKRIGRQSNSQAVKKSGSQTDRQ